MHIDLIFTIIIHTLYWHKLNGIVRQGAPLNLVLQYNWCPYNSLPGKLEFTGRPIVLPTNPDRPIFFHRHGINRLPRSETLAAILPCPVLLSSPIGAFLSPPIASPSLHQPRGPPWLEWGRGAGTTRGWRGDEAPERRRAITAAWALAAEALERLAAAVAKGAARRARGWPSPSPRPGHRRATRLKDGGTGSWGSSAPSRGAPPPGSSAGEGREGAASPAQLRYCPSRRPMGGGREGAARHKVSSTCISSSWSRLHLPPMSQSAAATVPSPSSIPIMSVVGCSSPSWRWRWAFPLLSWCRREGPVGVHGLILLFTSYAPSKTRET
jgi:hypothetical protein